MMKQTKSEFVAILQVEITFFKKYVINNDILQLRLQKI